MARIINYKAISTLSLLVVALFIVHIEVKMLYTYTIARHGAAYPPNDLYDGNQTKPFRGLLTPIGLRQQYNLGTYLQQDYINIEQLTTPKFNPNHVEFYSTSKQRTQNSALAFIYGLFPLGYGWTIPNEVPADKLSPPYKPLFPEHLKKETQQQFALNKGFQPLPVRPIDNILDNCPYYDTLLVNRLSEIAQVISKFEIDQRTSILRMKNIFNLTQAQTNVQTMSDLYDTIYADLNLGHLMPSNFLQTDLKNLKYMYQFYNAWIFRDNFAKVLATPSLRMIRAKMTGIINKSNLKLTFLFGHHSNVLPLLFVLNITSPQCLTQQWKGETVTSLNCGATPHFAANLILQLHQNDSLQYLVRVKYNGNYVNLCEQKSTQCFYDEFKQRLQNMETNFEQQCKVKDSFSDEINIVEN